ncbi:MAG: hypothetical protein WKF60_06265, partial [Ilumatobacter sp.]
MYVKAAVAEQFGQSYYVTGQIATLEMRSGRLAWLNAGHVLPLLVPHRLIRRRTRMHRTSSHPQKPEFVTTRA